MLSLKELQGLIHGFGIPEENLNISANGLSSGKTDLLLTELGSEILHRLADNLLHGFIHVHLHQEVKAAPEIETQLERMSSDASEPVRSGSGKIESYHIFISQLLGQLVLDAETQVIILKSDKRLTVLMLNFALIAAAQRIHHPLNPGQIAFCQGNASGS